MHTGQLAVSPLERLQGQGSQVPLAGISGVSPSCVSPCQCGSRKWPLRVEERLLFSAHPAQPALPQWAEQDLPSGLLWPSLLQDLGPGSCPGCHLPCTLHQSVHTDDTAGIITSSLSIHQEAPPSPNGLRQPAPWGQMCRGRLSPRGPARHCFRLVARCRPAHLQPLPGVGGQGLRGGGVRVLLRLVWSRTSGTLAG